MGYILTVAVASYNVQDYLDKALQSYSDDCFSERLQVIIVDDGSTDNTAAIAQRYVDAHPAIFQLISKPNGGHGSAVNTALYAARGKYFRIIDGDDWANTDNLRVLIDIMESSDVDMIVDEKREVNMVTGATQLFELPSDVPTDSVVAFSSICNQGDLESYMMLHTCSIKTDLLKSIGLHLQEHAFYVDMEFIVKGTSVVQTVEFLRLEIYQYLVGNVAQSVDSANYVKRYDHHDRVLHEVLSFQQSFHGNADVKRYLHHKACLLVNTQMNIALIFDTDRARGSRRAHDLRAFLKAEYPSVYKDTQQRYRTARVLHALGFDAKRLNALMGRS